MQHWEAKWTEGWNGGMCTGSFLLHLWKLNMHTNCKAEMKSTGKLIWFNPFKQWNYFLYDFFPCQFLSFPCNAFSFLSFLLFLLNAILLCSFLFASVCFFLPLPFFSCSPLSFLSCFCSPMCSLSTWRTWAQIVKKLFFFPDAPFLSPCGFDCCSSVRF